MKRPTLEAIEAYVEATCNEQAVDLFLVAREDCGERVPPGCPRPLRLASVFSFWRPAATIALRTADLFWWYPLFCCLVGASALRSLWQIARAFPISQPLHGSCAVATTPRLGTLLGQVPTAQRPKYYLTMPWCNASKAPPECMEIGLLQLARTRDVWKALLHSWSGARAFSRKSPEPFARLQTYTAFKWFLTWQILQRQSSLDTVWFGNHYDRWAILIDRLPVLGKRVLIQHGFAKPVPFSHRLKQVKDFYFFDATTKQTLLSNILPPEATLNVVQLKPKLKLAARPHPAECRHLLLIGQPVEQEKEQQLLRALAEANPEAYIWLKPHPLYAYAFASEFTSGNVRIFDDPEQFPRVDVAVAGRSWLGIEYEASGVPVVWHWQRSTAETVRLATEILTQRSPNKDSIRAA